MLTAAKAEKGQTGIDLSPECVDGNGQLPKWKRGVAKKRKWASNNGRSDLAHAEWKVGTLEVGEGARCGK